ISDRAREFLLNGNIGTQWQDLSFNGKPVRAMLVPAEPAALPVNPFALVRQDVLGKAGDGTIADRGVFVAYVKPAAGPAGFVVVDEPVDKA
ncbi:CDP-diacylglycerol diphosphatase, partial [Klebsiella pneumoniae]|uniref:CDP-diacylglycerol diphosphatase n=2 Tax=Pseudomonadota TaxID=1224 RepID=UPI0021578595